MNSRMNTTKLHGAITSARGADPRHPGLPFFEAAAEMLEEHELRLGILSGHIIPERCLPHPAEPQAKYGGPGVKLCPTCGRVPAACECRLDEPNVLSQEEIDSLLEEPRCVRCGLPSLRR